MADTAFEFYLSLFYCRKNCLFANEASAGRKRGFGCFGVWRTNYADPQVGFDRVWKPEAVSNNRAVLLATKANMEFVFGGLRRASHFSSAKIPVNERGQSCVNALGPDCESAYCIASTKENCIASLRSGVKYVVRAFRRF